MLSGDVPPNQTIYIKNLNDKVKKEGDFSLILLLFCFFLFAWLGRVVTQN